MNRTSETPRIGLTLLIIITACFLFYGRTLSFGFVWDDFGLIVKTDALRKWSNLGKFFSTPYWILAADKLVPYHRPAAPLLILFASAFSGTAPWGYHLVSVLLFSVSACLFFLVVKSQTPETGIAEAAAAIYIFHPVNVEAASWVCCQPTLLSAICFLGALLISIKLRGETASKQLIFLALYFTAGLLSYHSVLTLPFLVFFRDLSDPEMKLLKPWKLRLKEYGLYVGLAGLFVLYNQLVIYIYTGGRQIHSFYLAANANVVYQGGIKELILAPLNTIARYAENLIFPLQLSPDAYFTAGQLTASSIGALLLLTLSGVSLLKSKTSDKKTVLFSVAWMLCGILTVSNIVPQGGLFADRYLMISLMGYAYFLALNFSLLKKYLTARFPKVRLAPFIGILVLVLLGTSAWNQMNVWKSDFSYWLYATKYTPGKARNHYNLATWWERAGRFKEAADEYETAFKMDPESFPGAEKHWKEMLSKIPASA